MMIGGVGKGGKVFEERDFVRMGERGMMVYKKGGIVKGMKDRE